MRGENTGVNLHDHIPCVYVRDSYGKLTEIADSFLSRFSKIRFSKLDFLKLDFHALLANILYFFLNIVLLASSMNRFKHTLNES